MITECNHEAGARICLVCKQQNRITELEGERDLYKESLEMLADPNNWHYVEDTAIECWGHEGTAQEYAENALKYRKEANDNEYFAKNSGNGGRGRKAKIQY